MKNVVLGILILAKREGINASCAQSIILEYDFKALIYTGDPQSQLDQMNSKIREAYAFRQGEFSEFPSFYRSNWNDRQLGIDRSSIFDFGLFFSI